MKRARLAFAATIAGALAAGGLTLAAQSQPAPKAPQIPDQSRFSPDGRWVAFNSDDSGEHQVYVTKFPTSGERWQVSADSGVQPIWRRDGRELYYLGLDGTMFAVDVRGTETFETGKPRPLFQAPVGAVNSGIEQYATVDGNRFLILKQIDRPPRPISVLVNWPSLLRK